MRDIEILKELGREYAGLAADPKNAERCERGYQTNELTPARPLVWIHEVPWHEMNVNDELTLRCESDEARDMEFHFRRRIYQWKHFQADMVLEPYYPVGPCYHTTEYGLSVQEEVLIDDPKNNIVSHAYLDQLDAIEKVNALPMPVVTRDREAEAKKLAFAHEVLDGILPVKEIGVFMTYSPWDGITRLRGMSSLLMDLAADPDLMHATIQKFYKIKESEADQMEALGLFSSQVYDLHCTPHYSRALEKEQAAHGSSARCAWLRATAQAFGQISPAMHEEYEIEYLIPLAKRFGLVYYGCCEALYDRIDMLKKLPNLRKVGVSPWSNVEISAEKLGGDYVFSRKPNPAMVAGTLNEDAVRKDIQETVEMCLKYGCPYDITLKDISTVGYKPQNLWRWAQIAEETIDKYY